MIIEDYHFNVSKDIKNCELKPSYIFGMLQDVAGLHAASYNLDRAHIIKKNLIWILVDQKLEFLAEPQYFENLVITTWPKNTSRIKYFRDYIIKNDNGEIICRASSTWCLFSLVSFRPTIDASVTFDGEFCKENALSNYENLNLIFNENYQKIGQYIITKENYDENNHANNTEYVKIIEKYYTEFKKIKSIQAHYHKQSFENDALDIYCFKENNVVNFILRNNETTVFTIKIEE